MKELDELSIWNFPDTEDHIEFGHIVTRISLTRENLEYLIAEHNKLVEKVNEIIEDRRR